MGNNVRPANDYEENLLEALKNSEEAAEYLNASLEEAMKCNNMQIFLLALRDVVKSRGATRVAGLANLNRESMYRMLSAKGNPEFGSLWNLLNSIGLKISIETRS